MKDFTWKLKYGLFKRKYNEKDVKQLLQYLDANMSVNDVEILLYLKSSRSKKKINELIYIYKKMKGGKK